MNKISCDVIKDLLPLYVDGVLSEDSCHLVAEHLAICSECRKIHDKMKSSDVYLAADQADKGEEVIKRIRKKIKLSKVLLICISVLVSLAVAVGGFCLAMYKESYVAFESTGLFIDKDLLCTDENYYCYYGFDSPEEGTMFIYMTTTFYESHRDNDEVIIVDDLTNTDNSDLREVYYIPQEYVNFMKNFGWNEADSEVDYLSRNQSKLDEIKEKSVLVWSEAN